MCIVEGYSNKEIIKRYYNNKTKCLGRFINYKDVVNVILKTEKEYYGEFANQSC